MDAYLDDFVSGVMENMQYRNGIFKQWWDYSTVILFMVCISPFLALGVLKYRFWG